MSEDAAAAANLPYRSIWTSLRDVEFRQSFLDVDGVRTRVAEAGAPELPPLVMLHGTGGHWETFAPNLGRAERSTSTASRST